MQESAKSNLDQIKKEESQNKKEIENYKEKLNELSNSIKIADIRNSELQQKLNKTNEDFLQLKRSQEFLDQWKNIEYILKELNKTNNLTNTAQVNCQQIFIKGLISQDLKNRITAIRLFRNKFIHEDITYKDIKDHHIREIEKIIEELTKV